MNEVHPIPQNVTSFQFKLVGDMTLKQFGYLAGGLGLAYIIFVLFAATAPYISWPLTALSALLGAAFAFLPIGSRPLDHWLAAFLKAIYSPTQRVWKKNEKTYKENPLFESRLIMYLAGLGQQPESTQPAFQQPSASPLQQINKLTNQQTSAPATPPTSTPINPASNATASLQPNALQNQPIASVPSAEEFPTKEQLQKIVDLSREAQNLQMKIIQTERTLSQIKEQAQKPSPIPVDYSEQVNRILADLQSLVNKTSAIKQQIQSVKETEQPQSETPVVAPSVAREKITIVAPSKPKHTTVALTTFPNVINGIVADKTGAYLEGTVAVIYDKEGLPVRALKTNKLGQFTGSTPLPNGTYTLELEKENLTFDVLQIELTGEVLPPLMIAAK